MSTTEEKIAVMQAFVKGKTIQVRFVREVAWSDCINPRWHWEYNEYRIKPEEKWVNLYGSSVPGAVFGHIYSSKELADRDEGAERIACIKLPD